VIPLGRVVAPIIVRGSGRASAASSPVPAGTQLARAEPAVAADPVNNSSANNAPARRAPLPDGRRPAADAVAPARSFTQPAVGSQTTRTPAVRPESTRVVAPPAAYRAPGGSAPVQSRVAPPAASAPVTVYRGPAPSGAVTPSATPRVESYRAPSPAPAPRPAAPVQSPSNSSR
jgi:hypothetical protein